MAIQVALRHVSHYRYDRLVQTRSTSSSDPEERARLRRVFSQGLHQVVGFALPLRPSWDGERLDWRSRPWFLRDERMFSTT